MRTAIAGLATAAVLAAVGCEFITDRVCPDECTGGDKPIFGEPSDYAGPRTGELLSSGEPLPCPDAGNEARAITVTTRGIEPRLGTSWVHGRLEPHLELAGVDILSVGLEVCSDGEYLTTVSTDDWSQVDPILDVVEQVAAEDDVATEFTLAVHGAPISCVSLGCTY